MAPSFVAPSLAARPTSTGPTHGQGRNGSRLTSLVAQTVKRLPTMRETWVQSLGREDLLEKEMAPHSSIFAWKIPWTEKPGGLQSMGSQRVGHDFTFTFMHNIQAKVHAALEFFTLSRWRTSRKINLHNKQNFKKYIYLYILPREKDHHSEGIYIKSKGFFWWWASRKEKDWIDRRFRVEVHVWTS